jgi:Leu/Phe-tRNA-protein transferase
VSLIVNNEEYLLRVLANTGASSSIILEAYTSAIFPFIKSYDNDTITWSIPGGKFTTTKTGMMLVTFSIPKFNLKKQICSS